MPGQTTFAKEAEAEREAKATPEPAVKQAELASLLDEIDNIVDTSGIEKLRHVRAFERALKLADGMQRLRDLVSLELVASKLMPLQNSRLGFMTDKPEGYSASVVRDCLIEAVLRGLHPVDNEFNIIAGGMYPAKNGLSRLVCEFPGLTHLELLPGVPSMVADKGALVPFVVKWLLDGEEHSIERIYRKGKDGQEYDHRIPVRVNKGMIVDAVLGKATRKALAAVYQQLTGAHMPIPQGEIEELAEDPNRDGAEALTKKLKAAAAKADETASEGA